MAKWDDLLNTIIEKEIELIDTGESSLTPEEYKALLIKEYKLFLTEPREVKEQDVILTAREMKKLTDDDGNVVHNVKTGLPIEIPTGNLVEHFPLTAIHQVRGLGQYYLHDVEANDGKLIVTWGCGDTKEYIIRGDVDALKEEVDDLKGWVGYQDEDVYGVECDMTNCVFTRLAGAVGKEAGADFDSINAFGGRRRCNLTDDGVVTAYYGDSAYTTSGALTTAVTVEDTTYPVGTNVQVMVEQPAFYYKVVPLVLDGQSLKKARYYVSDKAVNGFKLHPAFIENGHLNDKIYLSAYEGCLQSGSSYIKDDSAASSLTTAKLSSISEVQPVTGAKQSYTRSNARRTAENRGPGWELPYMATCAASQLLMLIEYASFNMQEAIGWGIASADEKVGVGGSDSLGNASGTVDIDGTNCYVSYRGEENLWGNIFSWLDGANTNNPSNWTNTTPPAVNTSNLYIADNNFTESTTASPYEDSGIHPVWAYPAYVSAFGYDAVHDWLFVPTECKGNDIFPVGNAWWNAYSGWRPWTCFGGRWSYGTGCGAFAYWVDATTTSAHDFVGARIVYIPSKNANI